MRNHFEARLFHRIPHCILDALPVSVELRKNENLPGLH